MNDERNHRCARNERRELVDARGLFCCYVCDVCEQTKRARYRPDIFTDSNYWTDEPIEPEEYDTFEEAAYVSRNVDPQGRAVKTASGKYEVLPSHVCRVCKVAHPGGMQCDGEP